MASIFDIFNNGVKQAQDLINSTVATANSVATSIGKPEEAIEWIRVESKYGPPILIRDPMKAGDPNAPPSEGEEFARLMKPKVTIKFRATATPLVIKPWGEPGQNEWPTVALVGGIGLASLAYLIGRGVYATAKPSSK